MSYLFPTFHFSAPPLYATMSDKLPEETLHLEAGEGLPRDEKTNDTPVLVNNPIAARELWL